jgi:ABC-type branched-subunit amino acid transport system substrate-binding protein
VLDRELMNKRIRALGSVALVAIGTMACTSTVSSPTTAVAGTAHRSVIPTSAYDDRTGITATSIHIGNVSTLSLGGLFEGALVGTRAYADYVNSMGGIDGRKIYVDSGNDNYTGAGNKQATQKAIANDAALVGDFSTFDSFGGVLLAEHPGIPDVSVVLDYRTNSLPNVFSPVPLRQGWLEGPLQYFKQRFPTGVKAVGAVIADLPSTEAQWQNEKYVMQKVGYKVIYDETYDESQVDFTQNVIAMRNQGVKVLFIDQMPEIYASALLKDLAQQNFHPHIVLGASAYSSQLVAASGGPSAVAGAYLNQTTSLYLGGDESTIPAVATFLHWVNVASPGFKPDLFTMYGWVSGSLFAIAVKNAGSDPSRGSILRALSRITMFDAGHIIAPTDPAAKTGSNCYLIAQVVGARFQRLDDPSVDGSTNGYRCDYQYVRTRRGLTREIEGRVDGVVPLGVPVLV